MSAPHRQRLRLVVSGRLYDTDNMPRDYAGLELKMIPDPDHRRAMQAFVDTLWGALHGEGIAWIGFYLYEGDDQLVLGPRRDKPACSPIGLHGACGRAFRSQQPVVVRDVAELGENYIACDPRDRSEVVVPLFDAAGRCWGVLDVDSHEPGAFTEADVTGLTRLLRAAGLTTRKTS